MSIQRNTVANLGGQVYTTLIGIVMLPLYLEFLGAEAYGLVGFFTLLQSWLMLLTAGVAPTLTREVGVYRGRGELAGEAFREMLRSFELIVVAVALASGLGIWISSDWLATEWLTVRELPKADVAYCIALMGVMIGLRWGITLYSSCLSGLERQVWLSGFNIAFATLRFGAAYVLIRWISPDPKSFFELQLAISVVELVVSGWTFYSKQLPASEARAPGLAISWRAIRSVLPFALGVGYTSIIWVFVTQSDKLILSHVLSLEQYGYFAVVGAIANGVLRFSEPLNQAVLPRLTMLFSQGEHGAMVSLYRRTTQYLAVLVFSVAGMVALFAQPLLFALTGNQTAARWGAPVLVWFALGNGVLVIAGMQYTMQFVHGQMRMHVLYSTINAVIQVPLIALVAYKFGAVAVAATWFAIRIGTFVFWPPVVHRKFAPGLHLKWLLSDVLPPLLGAVAGLMIVWFLSSATELLRSNSRLQLISVLLVLGCIALGVAGCAASAVRAKIFAILSRVSPALRPSAN